MPKKDANLQEIDAEVARNWEIVAEMQAFQEDGLIQRFYEEKRCRFDGIPKKQLILVSKACTFAAI